MLFFKKKEKEKNQKKTEEERMKKSAEDTRMGTFVAMNSAMQSPAQVGRGSIKGVAMSPEQSIMGLKMLKDMDD